MLCKGDTIGIFQVESAAQMQNITRLRPRNLLDMAHEVGAVRPGVGVNHGVQQYLARRTGRQPVTYDCPLEKRALERTLGVVLFQDQVNQLAIDVAGFSPSEADRLRRAFSRKHNDELIEQYHQKFLAGATERGATEEEAKKVFKKFNGQYMFPESHAFAFGVTAYQASWLKYYYPLEFFVAIFNQQPMGFYNLETLKEDAGRHGVMVLNPDINKSRAKCTIEPIFSYHRHTERSAEKGIRKGDVGHITQTPPRDSSAATSPQNDRPDCALRLGLLNVTGLGNAAAKAIETGREKGGDFKTIGEFLERTGVLEEVALNLAGAGAFDGLEPNRRRAKWEIGLRYRPINTQLLLPLPVSQDIVELPAPSDWERMKEEYNILNLFPGGHVMSRLRPRFNRGYSTSRDIGKLRDGAWVTSAGLVIRRQRPHGKVVFITLEDEFGHIPCMVFGKTYERYEYTFRSAFLIIKGRLTRREGTCNVVISRVEPFSALDKVPASKDFR
jgi:error-prone DNA polymerase